jgi:PAS domain S-box-containing protein
MAELKDHSPRNPTVSETDAVSQSDLGLLNSLADAISAMFWICDARGRSVYISKGWLDYSGMSPGDNLNDGGAKAVHPEDRERVEEEWRKALQNGNRYELRARLRRHDGATRWHRVQGVPERDASGTVKRWIVIWIDIDEEVARHAALAGTKEELERTVLERTHQLQEAVEELEAFAYSIAHDMRAPLRAMHMYAETVARDFGLRVPEEARGFLNKIMGAAEKLDLLIREVLVYTRVSQGRMNLQPINLDLLLSEVLVMQPQLNPPHVELSAQLPLHTVIGDETALTQVFTNLLTNAVKFVPEGRKPKVNIWTETTGDKVRIHVKDNGIGMATTDLKRIFKMFERLQPDSKYEGSGIGLTIVRRAVERMGGTLGVESIENEGSTFWVELQKGERC